MDDHELQNLWQSFAQHKQVECRNRLFLFYSNWMRKIVSSQFSRYGGQLVEWVDCVQNASIALIESIERYDFSRGIPFEAYAYARVKGAIINGIAHFQSDRKNAIHEEFLTDIQLSDDPDEIFDSFVDSVIEIAFSRMLDMASQRYKEMSANPLDVYLVRSEENKITRCVELLSPELRFIINAHYNHYLTLTQIAKEMNLSKSRVSQMHKTALKQIRNFYEKT